MTISTWSKGIGANARELLIKDKVIGSDPLVDKILEEPEGAEALLFLEAKKLKASSLKRMYVESALLASDNLEEIAELLEIKLEILGLQKWIVMLEEID